MVLMGAVDTAMVGRVSPTALASVALGSLYFFTTTVFAVGVLMALDPVVSQAFGAGDREGVARGTQRGVVLALALTVLATLVVMPVRPLLVLFRQPSDVVPIASGYVFAAAPGILPFLLFVVLRQTLQAMGRVGPIVWAIAIANLGNVLFNWLLIFGKLGFPELGAVGAGVASSLSRGLMAVGVVVVAWPVLRPLLVPIRPEALRLAPLIRMVRIGAPIGVQFSLEFGAFAVIGLMMGWLGTVPMAGHQVAINLASLTFMVPLGVGQATAVLVGRSVGRADSPGARRAAGAGLLVGSAFMAGTALVFLTVPGVLARIFTAEPEVLVLATALIPLAGLFQVFDGIQAVASAALRGVGDTRIPMIMNVLGFWVVGLPVSLYVGFVRGAGSIGLWWGLVAGLAAVAVLLSLRVRRRFGAELARVVIDEPGGSGG